MNTRVLIVDDNETAAHGIGKLLTLAGYEVSYAYSGQEAIDRVIDWDPFAVVLDIGLPDMDGYAVAKALRSDAKYRGILIALTGYSQLEDRQKASEAGFDHHLVKPIGSSELQQVLRPLG